MELENQQDTQLSIIEKELDQITVRILTLMDQYIKCQKNIEKHIRSGCLDLAKARYIIGNHNISSLQLPGEDASCITANFKVTTSAIDDVIQFRSLDTTESFEEIYSRLENVTINSENESRKKNTSFSKDPLRWFGFLVPQNLKQSKMTFEKCLEVIVECANIKLELQHNLGEFQSRKKSLSNYS